MSLGVHYTSGLPDSITQGFHNVEQFLADGFGRTRNLNADPVSGDIGF